jgi:hypothetical protein
MKSLASLLLSILFGIIVVVLAIKLLGAALKLVAILIGLALAVGAYFVLKGMIGKGKS